MAVATVSTPKETIRKMQAAQNTKYGRSFKGS
jgi:hypothetical protein